MNTQRFQKRSGGFTLIELLTAVTITVVIVGVLIGMTRLSMDSWKESSDKVQASRLAKESLEVMARDFEGMVIRSGNDYEWLFLDVKEADGGGPNQESEIKNPLELAFFTAATDRYDGQIGDPNDDKGGDISTVVYRLKYEDNLDPGSGNFPYYTLYRKRVDPDETFGNPGNANSGLLSKSELKTAQDYPNEDSGSDAIIQSDNLLAENVYNMSITAIFEYPDQNGETKQLRVPVAEGGDVERLSIKGNVVQINNGNEPLLENITGGIDISTTARLSSVELGVLVINESGMNALRKKSFPNSAKFNEFLKQNSNYFTKSVTLPRP